MILGTLLSGPYGCSSSAVARHEGCAMDYLRIPLPFHSLSSSRFLMCFWITTAPDSS
jgi:hypothetical protein